MAPDGNEFLRLTNERADLNQYWFSRATIDSFVAEILDSSGSVALVSSPSVYFSLPAEARARSKVLDFDRQWESDPGYVFYDFNAPVDLPGDLHAAFDFVLVDPPFITREVWAKYAETTKFLLRRGGRILCTTIAENAPMMSELLGIEPVLFRPSIPSLVYQYSVYTNYHSDRLATLNPEIDDADWRAAGTDVSVGSKEVPLPGEIAVIGGRSITDLKPEVVVAAALEAESAGGAEVVDQQPLPPAAALLTDLRERLGVLKRRVEALRLPVQQAVRRQSATGRSSSAAQVALEAAESSALALQDWLVCHTTELPEALGETSDTVTSDRWLVDAVLALVAVAKDGSLHDMAAYQDWLVSSKDLSTALFKQGGVLLEHIKLLKRAAT